MTIEPGVGDPGRALTPRLIAAPTCTGEFLDQGAQVLRWQPVGAERPVLWVSERARLEHGKAVRGGIPVCWPWFGPGRGAAPAEPLHGPVRTALWRLRETKSSQDGVHVSAALSSDDARTPHFPHPYRLRLDAWFGAELRVVLTTTNIGAQPVEFEEALHAYLVVGDSRRVHLDGLDGTPYRDKVTARDEVQQGPLRLDGETDQVHRSPGPVTVHDPVLRRRLVVHTAGAANVVVWNPGAVKGAALSDIGGGWPGFVCVEAANALADGVTLEPGESHTLAYRLQVQPLTDQLVDPSVDPPTSVDGRSAHGGA